MHKKREERWACDLTCPALSLSHLVCACAVCAHVARAEITQGKSARDWMGRLCCFAFSAVCGVVVSCRANLFVSLSFAIVEFSYALGPLYSSFIQKMSSLSTCSWGVHPVVRQDPRENNVQEGTFCRASPWAVA